MLVWQKLVVRRQSVSVCWLAPWFMGSSVASAVRHRPDADPIIDRLVVRKLLERYLSEMPHRACCVCSAVRGQTCIVAREGSRDSPITNVITTSLSLLPVTDPYGGSLLVHLYTDKGCLAYAW